MRKTKTIAISKEFYKYLFSKKSMERETFEDVLKRLIKTR